MQINQCWLLIISHLVNEHIISNYVCGTSTLQEKYSWRVVCLRSSTAIVQTKIHIKKCQVNNEIYACGLNTNGKNIGLNSFLLLSLVMGRTPFYWTSNKLEHHFSNIKNELKNVYLLMIELENLNFGFQRTDFKHWTYKPFSRFTNLFVIQTRTPFFWTPNVLERVHLMVIKFQYPIFGFKRSNDRTLNIVTVTLRNLI